MERHRHGSGAQILNRSLIKNAAVLTGTSLILRTVGIVFRIWISGRIGAAGMGLYQLVFSVYVLASTFASSGISTAVTRMVADELIGGSRRSVRQVMRRSIGISVAVGAASAAVIILFAKPIAALLIREAAAAASLRILSFSLPFMGVASCFKGYFIARERVGIPSVAQLLEQVVRIGATLLLLLSSDGGIVAACEAIILADAVAETVSAIFLACRYLADRRQVPPAPTVRPRQQGVVKQICEIALPITAGRYLSTALRTAENMLVPACLTVFLGSSAEGLRQFGLLKGMALPLLFFPASLLNAITTLLIPEMSKANTLGQQDLIREAAGRAVKLTLLGSILAGGIFTVAGGEIAAVVYHSEEVGALLRVLAPLMPIMYLESIVDGILKGLNQQMSSLKYSALDSAVRIVLIALLVPPFGMKGFLFIMVISNYLTGLLNLRRLLKVTGLSVAWRDWLIKPILAMGAAGATISLLRFCPAVAGWPPLAVLTVFGGLAAGGYLLLILPMGCLSRQDFR